MSKRSITMLSAAVALVAALVLPAAPAAASTPAPLPAPAFMLGIAGMVGRSYATIKVAPGSTWSGAVKVIDPASRSSAVELYPTDGLTAPNTGVSFALAGQPLRPAGAPHAEGSWLTLGRSRLSVPASSAVKVPLRVTVPVGALPGEHVAGVALQPITPQKSLSGNLAVTVVSRVVMAVVVVVPGPSAFHLAIGRPKFPTRSARTSHPAISIPLTDTGTDYAKAKLSATITGPSGYRRHVSRQLNVVLPGDTAHVSIPWLAPLAAGTYAVTLHATWPGGGSSATFHTYFAKAVHFSASGARPGSVRSHRTGSTAHVSLASRLISALFHHLALAGSAVAAGLLLLLILLLSLRRRRYRGAHAGGRGRRAPSVESS